MYVMAPEPDGGMFLLKSTQAVARDGATTSWTNSTSTDRIQTLNRHFPSSLASLTGHFQARGSTIAFVHEDGGRGAGSMLWVCFCDINNMIWIKIKCEPPAMTRGFLHISRSLLNLTSCKSFQGF